jgi:hypothetical protein
MHLPSVRLLSPLIAATALLAAALPASGLGAKSPARKASLSIARVSVAGTTVTVSGRVNLPDNTAARRARTRVLLTLTNQAGRVERLPAARITPQRYFKATKTTNLLGTITVTGKVTIAGRQSGSLRTRRFTISPPPAPGPLLGTFKLEAGAAPSSGSPTGTYFQMIDGGGSPVTNLSSPSPNKEFTPLTPGTDGGLRTDVYQGPPSPAFAGGGSGDALAARIIKPVPFFGTNFSIVTAATDPQLGTPDPLPDIQFKNGKLSGQITAWAAQWNGQSFNQGTPKPDGSTPPPTTPLSGTYDSAARKFTLDWKSRIVGGPFNGFTGVWHLAGTFVPA